MIVYTNLHKTPFLIDDNDYDKIKNHKWSINNGYPTTNIRSEKYLSGWRAMTLHLFLMGIPPKGYEWDHKNLNRLDNRKENLQLLTMAENREKKNLYRTSTTGHAGILYRGTWRVRANYKGIRYNVGEAQTLEEAIKLRQAFLERVRA